MHNESELLPVGTVVRLSGWKRYAQPAPEYNPNQNMNYQNPNAQPVAPQQAPAQQTSTVNMPQPPMQNDQNPNQ